MPFQIVCASHSPQMIDISKDHTSLVRMVKSDTGATSLYQVKREDLKNEEQKTDEEIKQKIYELLRFDPFVCESFYADEVVLVEGDSEAIIWRGYEQNVGLSDRNIFVVNCHSCNNIPFYQKVFSKFNIRYSVICDTDHTSSGDKPGTNKNGWNMNLDEPKFQSGIQKVIEDLYYEDKNKNLAVQFLVFPMTFEPCHIALDEPYRYEDSGTDGKPFKADRYWKKIVNHKDEKGFSDVPIISYIQKIINA